MLFPHGRLPLRLFEQRYLEMAKDCLKQGSAFGVCLIVEGREVGEPAIPVSIGTTARIVEWDMPHLGVLHIIAQGERRFRILERRVQSDGLASARVELLDEGADGLLLESFTACARLTEVLPLPLAAKQALLELDDARERLLRVNALLANARAGS